MRLLLYIFLYTNILIYKKMYNDNKCLVKQENVFLVIRDDV